MRGAPPAAWLMQCVRAWLLLPVITQLPNPARMQRCQHQGLINHPTDA